MITGNVATHCPHAGPAGDKLDAAAGQCIASPCMAFCNLATKVCGTNANPMVDIVNRYDDMDACTHDGM